MFPERPFAISDQINILAPRFKNILGVATMPGTYEILASTEPVGWKSTVAAASRRVHAVYVSCCRTNCQCVVMKKNSTLSVQGQDN